MFHFKKLHYPQKWMINLVFSLGIAQASSAISSTDQSVTSPDAANQATPSPVLIFVSFSMPLVSLQQWSQQAQSIHAPLIIQGLVQHSFTQTQQAVKALSQDNSAGVVLDPRLFREYHITQVPAVVVRRISHTPCPANQSCLQVYDVVSGDVGLEAVLQQIADRGDVADVARSILSQARSS